MKIPKHQMTVASTLDNTERIRTKGEHTLRKSTPGEKWTLVLKSLSEGITERSKLRRSSNPSFRPANNYQCQLYFLNIVTLHSNIT